MEEEKINDDYKEHCQHTVPVESCSECFNDKKMNEVVDLLEFEDDRDSLGTNIRRGVEEDFIRDPNPLE